MLHLDNIKISKTFDYSRHQSLSNESREKLQKIRPENLGQASRIPGIKPVDISVLLVALT